MSLHQTLPKGEWYFFKRLPLDTSPQALSDWFSQRGMDVPPNRISVKDNGHRCTAAVSLSKETMLTLVSWAINGERFQGYDMIPQIFANDAKNAGGTGR